MIEALRLIAMLVLPLGVIIAALRDLTSYTIPNKISVALLAAFLPAALVAGFGLPQIGVSLGVGATLLALGVAMFTLRWIGGGDAKLLAACGVWLGWPAALSFCVWTALAGGGLALMLMAGRRVAVPIAGRGPPWVGRLLQPGGDVPYGLAICFGALAAYPASPIVQAALGLH